MTTTFRSDRQPSEIKQCIKCKQTKPLESFSFDKGGPRWRRDYKVMEFQKPRYFNTCKECARAERLRYKFDLQRRCQTAVRDSMRRSREDGCCPITTPAYIIAATYTGNCFCCDKPEDARNTKDSLVIDHCHKTGNFRGWLCRRCNLAVEFADDNINRLRQLIVYLENFGDKQ